MRSNTDCWFYNVKTVFTECDGFLYWNCCARVFNNTNMRNVSHLRTEAQNRASVYIWGGASEKLVSHKVKEHMCLCPWMWCLLKSLSQDSLHLSGRCNIKLHFAVDILNIPCIFRTEDFCSASKCTAMPLCLSTGRQFSVWTCTESWVYELYKINSCPKISSIEKVLMPKRQILQLPNNFYIYISRCNVIMMSPKKVQ